MKMTISWHKECLMNRKIYLEKIKKEAKSLQKEIKKSEKEIIFYSSQIEEAKKKKKDGFDRDRFMVKKGETNDQER